MPLDVGVGLILGILLSHLNSYNHGLCLAIGVAASLLYDLDFIWSAVRTKSVIAPGTEHRDGLHYPLIVIPFLGVLGSLINPALGLVLALGALLHFIHDSIGVEFGVKWLFPFKKNSYAFFYHTGLPTNKGMPREKLYSWSDKEREEARKRYGDPERIKHIYLRPHPYGVAEYAVCLVGVLAAVLGR